jgi:murein L,D-transpeptidase YafK
MVISSARKIFLPLLCLFVGPHQSWAAKPLQPDPVAIAHLNAEIGNVGVKAGDPIFLRIFKQSGPPTNDLVPSGGAKIEVWMKPATSDSYVLAKTIPVDHFAGKLGPKKKKGDLQGPEGFYGVSLSDMNPNNQFHQSMNIGYPNSYDRAHGRTGSGILIHGNGVSVGCYALTNSHIEELYYLVHAAFAAKVQTRMDVNVFPFPLTRENIEQAPSSELREFWKMLSKGYDSFEENHQPPRVSLVQGKYVIGAPQLAAEVSACPQDRGQPISESEKSMMGAVLQRLNRLGEKK